MIQQHYQGVILAAGQGTRLGPFGETFPKPIVPICNKPLLAYQLEQMRGVGIEEVFIVIGHLGHRIIQAIGDGAAHGVRVTYVEQERQLGIAHAVGQLSRHVDKPFVLMLGDIYFEGADLGALIRALETHEAAAVLAVKEEQDHAAVQRNFAVVAEPDGAVREVVEKPRRQVSLLKGCGLYLFDERIFDAIRRTPRTAMRDEYELTDSIQILIDSGHTVRCVPAVDWDLNVTYIGDLIACCVHELRKRNLPQLVGTDCHIADGSELVDTVIGDRVTIAQPVRLERCVALADAVIDESAPCRGCVFTPAGRLNA